MESASRKRILYCEGNIDGTIGGSYFSLFYLVQGLDRTLYEPIVVFQKYNDLIPEYRESGIDTRVIEKRVPYSFPSPSAKSFAGYTFIYPLLRLLQKPVNFWRFLPLAALEHARYLRRNKIDLIHLNNSIVRNHDWMLGAQLSFTKCITHERGFNNSYSRIARYYAKRLSAVVCISNAIRQNLVSKNVASDRLVTIYNAIDPRVLTVKRPEQEIRRQHNILSTDTVIGVVGNIRQWKGQETAIRALPQVLKRYPSTKCLIIGDVAEPDSYYMRHLLKEVSRLDIEKNVIFVDFVDNIADYLNIMDIVLHTSIMPEPFGRVLIEAMSLKKPLIGANGGAVPEIIEHGKTGLIFTPGNPQELAGCIFQVLRAPNLAKNMGEDALDRVNELFHIDQHVQKIQNLYTNILSD